MLKAGMAQLAAENGQLQRQLDTAGIELSGARLDLEEAQQELAALRAALANATSASSLHLHQAVAETQPIPVITLAEAAHRGRL